jgi:hypothetical protein
MRIPIPRAPDLLALWRTRILDDLAEEGIAADVGPKRPASVAGLQGRFVRIMCLGGPWRRRALWYPRLATEAWAPSVAQARELDAIVARTTARLEGYRQQPSPTNPVGFFISSCSLDVQGAASSIDGAPLVLTTTDPLCVQILHHV